MSAKIIKKRGSWILAGEGVGKMKGKFSQGIADTPLHALLGDGVPQSMQAELPENFNQLYIMPQCKTNQRPKVITIIPRY